MKTAKINEIHLIYQEYFQQTSREAAKAIPKSWYFWATQSWLDPIIKTAKTIKKPWDNFLNRYKSLTTIDILEGFNSLVQAVQTRARSFRTDPNLITLAYLIACKLDSGSPT